VRLDVGVLRKDLTARKVRVVAIDGRGGSGKSTLARQLAEGWSKAVVVEMDDFYRRSAERVERPAVPGANWDCERLVTEVLGPHTAGRAGRYQRYDWDNDRLAEWLDVPADAIVVVEGVCSTSEPLRRYVDYAIWVDCPHDVRLKRGLERDGEGMRAEWVEEWMPAEDRYAAAEEPDVRADLVLDGSGTGADGVVFEVLNANPSGDALSDPAQLSFERDGVQLACLDFGGSGPPVLLLHGLAGHAAEWSETASWLVREHRVVALDERGHGRSTRVPANVSREAHVADVVFIIDRLALGPVILIGQSLGANLAFLVAARHPDRVRALVVAEGCPEADPEGEGAEGVRKWLDGWPTPFESRDAALIFFKGPSLYASAWADGLEQREGGWWPRFDSDVMVRTLREGTLHDYWEEWQQIKCPTLVVRAGDGFFPDGVLPSMAERLPGAKFVDIPGAKHDLHLDRPAEWRREVASFLASRQPSPPSPPAPSHRLVIPAGLEDDSISLMPWSKSDLGALQEASLDKSITRITAVPTVYSRDAGLRFLMARQESADRGEALSMAIHDRASGATLGGVNLNSFDWELRSARAGYWVVISGRGRGAATRALKLISTWGLGSLGLRELELHVEPGNAASINVATAAGYNAAGTVKDRPFGKDQELSMLRYVLNG
jgi:pimeloyl-ACP methyl ester carboxylesterase/RimJ/RimL family protein N-acetyltransferase/uridine kinase